MYSIMAHYMKDKREEYEKYLHRNALYFEKKFGVPVDQTFHGAYMHMVNYIKQDSEAPIQILIVNNRFSCLATKIQFKYPNAQVHSIENNVAISSITSKLYDARCLDIEKDRLPYSEESFDYIFMLDAFEQLKDPADTLQYLKKFLKHDGHFILRARNANHISVLESLAYGNLAKPKVATCVQRGAKLYTTDDMSALLQENGFQISQLTWIYHTKKELANEAQKRILDTLLSLPDAKDENTFLHTGVVFDAVREL